MRFHSAICVVAPFVTKTPSLGWWCGVGIDSLTVGCLWTNSPLTEVHQFHVAVEPGSEYLKLRVSGEITEQRLIELGIKIRELSNQHQTSSVLLDCAGIEGALSAGALFYATQEYIRQVGAGIDVAYVNPPAAWVPVDDQFSRDVARNRGGSLEVFANELLASFWLRQRRLERGRHK